MVSRRRRTCKTSQDRLNDLPIRYKPGNGRTVIACGVSDEPDERGKQYRAPLAAFWRAPSFDVDRGFGRQRALPLAAMSDPNAPEPPTQGGLFEVTLA